MDPEKASKGVSFSLKSSKTLSVAAKAFEEKQETKKRDFILSLDDKEIQSVNPVEPEKELIIPCLPNEITFGLKSSSNGVKKDEKQTQLKAASSTLDIQAVNEILKESTEEKKVEVKQDITIGMTNADDGPLDVSNHPDQSNLEDYDRIPVNAFGAALLKGMGWREGEGIGKNKKNVELKEVVLRPKGLGLGADPNVLQSKRKDAKTKENEKEFEVKSGAYVIFNHGQHKGLYGQIEGLDGDEGRLFIRLAISDKRVSVPEIFVNTVSKKEYKKESKVMNKQMVDKYNEKESVGFTDDSANGHEKPEKSRSKKHKYEDDERKSEAKKPKTHSKDRWVVPHLRIRFVDKDYKKGKYYNMKLVVEDVVSSKECTCRDGNKLVDLPLKSMETVIPRGDDAPVMVVQGKYKNYVGHIIKRDKASCTATVYLLQEKHSHVFDYDDICEYLGDISHID